MTGTRKRRVSGRLAATRQKASDASAHHPTLQAGPGLLRKRIKMTSTRLGDALKGSLSIPRPCASTGWERSSQTMPPAPRKAGGRPGCSMRSPALTLIRDAGLFRRFRICRFKTGDRTEQKFCLPDFPKNGFARAGASFAPAVPAHAHTQRAEAIPCSSGSGRLRRLIYPLRRFSFRRKTLRPRLRSTLVSGF